MDPVEWFPMARATKATADPMKTQIRHGRFDVRRNFFTAGVPGTEHWNKVPNEKTHTKNRGTVYSFNSAYRYLPYSSNCAQQE